MNVTNVLSITTQYSILNRQCIFYDYLTQNYLKFNDLFSRKIDLLLYYENARVIHKGVLYHGNCIICYMNLFFEHQVEKKVYYQKKPDIFRPNKFQLADIYFL